MVSVNTAEVLDRKFPPPLYTAVILCLPVVRKLNVSSAAPLLKLTVPRSVEPSQNDTVPVGVPDPSPAGRTDAVNVTGVPTGALVLDAERLVLVESWLTVTFTGGDV